MSEINGHTMRVMNNLKQSNNVALFEKLIKFSSKPTKKMGEGYGLGDDGIKFFYYINANEVFTPQIVDQIKLPEHGRYGKYFTEEQTKISYFQGEIYGALKLDLEIDYNPVGHKIGTRLSDIAKAIEHDDNLRGLREKFSDEVKALLKLPEDIEFRKRYANHNDTLMTASIKDAPALFGFALKIGLITEREISANMGLEFLGAVRHDVNTQQKLEKLGDIGHLMLNNEKGIRDLG